MHLRPRHSPRPMPLSIDERIQVILLAGSGRTHREIAEEFSRLHPYRRPISHATVGNLLTKFRDTGAVYDRSTVGSLMAKFKDTEAVLDRRRQRLSSALDGDGSGSPASDRTSEQLSSKMGTSAFDTAQEGKRYRYAVVDIKDQSSDDLYDVLINNGYTDFLLLDNLSDHPDFEFASSRKEESKPFLSLECESDISRAPSSNEGPADVPFFAEVSATDLLGGSSGIGAANVDAAGEGPIERKPSPLFENYPRYDSPNTSTASENGQNQQQEHIHHLESSGEGTDSETYDGDGTQQGIDYQSPYVICQLCKKVIMASRFSNLSNHARRHSVIKKFKCVYCDLQHNEHAKVRTHMANMHADRSSVAIDNSWRMKKVWEFLLQKCFPHYTQNNEPQPVVVENDLVLPPTTGSVAFVCGICGFHGADQWKVRWHISAQHGGEEPDTSVRAFLAEAKLRAKAGNGQGAVMSLYDERPSDKSNGSREDTSFEVYVSKPDAEHEDGLRSLVCRLCNRVIDGRGLVSVVMHAKAHYHVKQFECSRCGFGSNTRTVVRKHIYSLHRRGCSVVIEHNDDIIRKAWTQVVRACFPNLPGLLEKEEREDERNGIEVDLEL